MVPHSHVIGWFGFLIAVWLQPSVIVGQQSDDPPASRSLLRFDDNSHVELSNTKGLLHPSEPFTVELWFRARLGSDGKFPLVGDFVDRRHPDIQHPDRAGWNLFLGQTSGETLSFGARFAGFETGGPLPVDERQWCHIAMASERDGLSIYINGRRWHEKYSTDKIKWKNSPVPLSIGVSKYSPAIEGHQVDIGDLRISSTCLYTDDFNPPTILEKRRDTLVLLNFSRADDKRISDLSGEEHHGTIRGAKWIELDEDSVSMPVHKVIFQGVLGTRSSSQGIVPRFNRWEFQFSPADSQEYARQLDFFGIELGVLSRDSKQVHYAAKLSESPSTSRTTPRELEKRLYFVRGKQESSRLDEPLLRESGIETADQMVMQFFPPHLENLAAVIERDHATESQHTIQEVVKTVFELRPQGKHWKWNVVDMKFRSVGK